MLYVFNSVTEASYTTQARFAEAYVGDIHPTNAVVTVGMLNTGLSGYSPTTHTHTFASLTSKPTTLAGYGITDAASSSHTHTFASLTSKPTTLSGYGITDAVSSSDSRLTDARTPINNANYVFGDNSRASVRWNGTTFGSILKSGFYDSNVQTDAPVASTWTHVIHRQHQSDDNWSWQLAANYVSGNTEGYYTRVKVNGTWMAWRYCVTTDSAGIISNKIDSPRITSQRSLINGVGTYQVDSLNDTIVVLSAGVTLRGFAMDGVVTIYNAQDATVIYDNNGSIYYQQGVQRTGSITIPARRCLIIRGGVRNYQHVSLD